MKAIDKDQLLQEIQGHVDSVTDELKKMQAAKLVGGDFRGLDIDELINYNIGMRKGLKMAKHIAISMWINR